MLDLGPEGGQEGGRLVAQGTPEDLVRQGSHTGVALGPVLARGAVLHTPEPVPEVNRHAGPPTGASGHPPAAPAAAAAQP